MARHLLDLGHGDVGVYSPASHQTAVASSNVKRRFCKEFEREGLKGHVLIKAADESMDRKFFRDGLGIFHGIPADHGAAEGGKYFTAIAGQNDMMAIGAIDALEKSRIHVPRDVSVIGCDNIFYSGIRSVSLTTMDHLWH